MLTGYTPHPPRKEISKTALGADRSVPWQGASDPTKAMLALRREGYALYALELTDKAIRLDQLETITPFPERLAFIVGNEISGVRPETLALCDGAFSIPMFGVKHSLNVAVAFGIAAWEIVQGGGMRAEG